MIQGENYYFVVSNTQQVFVVRERNANNFAKSQKVKYVYVPHTHAQSGIDLKSTTRCHHLDRRTFHGIFGRKLELAHVDTSVIRRSRGPLDGVVPYQNVAFFGFGNHSWRGFLLKFDQLLAEASSCHYGCHCVYYSCCMMWRIPFFTLPWPLYWLVINAFPKPFWLADVRCDWNKKWVRSGVVVRQSGADWRLGLTDSIQLNFLRPPKLLLPVHSLSRFLLACLLSIVNSLAA